MHPDHRPGSRLRSLDFLGDERELRAAALADLEAAGGAYYRTPQCEEARDSTGSIRVAVNQKGVVADVHFRYGWRADLIPQQLGAALLEAYGNAIAAMANALALGVLAEEERNLAENEGRPRAVRALQEAPEPDIREIWQMLSGVEDVMYQVGQAGRQASERAARVVCDSSRLFKATCAGHAITSITVEPSLVEQADTEQLRSAALKLFDEAARLTGREML